MNFDVNKVTRDTLEQMRDGASQEDMIKAWMAPGGATTGIQNYDLEKPALSLFPVETPLVNKIPVVNAKGGIQANWRAITGINVNGLSAGLSEGGRGGVVASSTADYFAKYASFGLDDFVTEEAELAAEDYMDLVARAQVNLMYATKIQMERIYLGGLSTYGLGTTPQPSAADVGTGGAIPFNTGVSVIVVALSLDGYLNGSVAGGLQGLISRTNLNGKTDQYGGGTAQPSAARLVTTANDAANNHSVTSTVASVAGAVAYGWFWGPTGSEVLGAITTINSVLITTASGTGTQRAAALTADNSANQLVCDGLLSQIAHTGMGGYMKSLAAGTAGTGTPLTADGDGGVVEIDAALQYFYDKLRLTPSGLWVSSQEQLNISKKIAQGPATGTSNLRFTRATDGSLAGAVIARSYLNRFTPGITGGDQAGTEIPIKLHPNLPPGTMMFDIDRLPYPMNGIGNVVEFGAQRNYYATLWPQTSRQKEFGVYLRGVLKNYFIPGFGIINNIGNG